MELASTFTRSSFPRGGSSRNVSTDRGFPNSRQTAAWISIVWEGMALIAPGSETTGIVPVREPDHRVSIDRVSVAASLGV